MKRPVFDQPVFHSLSHRESTFANCPHSSSLIKGTLANDTVILKIAGHLPEYHVNKPLLCEKSAFFAKAFQQGGMKESVNGRIELHDIAQSVLQVFICWVYTGDIQFLDGSELISHNNFPFLVQLYKFADVYDTLNLRNDIVKKYYGQERNRSNASLTVGSTGRALQALRQGSKLYSLILDLMLLSSIKDGETVKKICRQFPLEAVEVLFTNCVLKTFKGVGPMENYLESDPSN